MSNSRSWRELPFLTSRVGLTCGVILLHLLLTTGCEDNNPLGRQAIEGHVMLDGKPLNKGSIEFTPRQRGGVSSGAEISEGHYMIEATKGLPPGSYLVLIFAPELPKGSQTETDPMLASGTATLKDTLGIERIPPEYNVDSTQTIEVSTEGPNQFDYDIKTK